MQVDYDQLFTLLKTEKEIEVLINPFVNAYLNDVMDQLEGQIATAKGFPLHNYIACYPGMILPWISIIPDEPKIVRMGNYPQKIQTYGAVLSLFVNRLTA